MVVLALTKVHIIKRNINRNKREHFIKESIHQDDLTILNVYVPNDKDSKIPEEKKNTYQIEISIR